MQANYEAQANNPALNTWWEINRILKQHGYEYVEIKDDLASQVFGIDKYHWVYRKTSRSKSQCCCGATSVKKY